MFHFILFSILTDLATMYSILTYPNITFNVVDRPATSKLRSMQKAQNVIMA